MTYSLSSRGYDRITYTSHNISSLVFFLFYEPFLINIKFNNIIIYAFIRVRTRRTAETWLEYLYTPLYYDCNNIIPMLSWSDIITIYNDAENNVMHVGRRYILNFIHDIFFILNIYDIYNDCFITSKNYLKSKYYTTYFYTST